MPLHTKRRRTSLLSATILGTSLLLTLEATGQERIYVQEIPDLKLHRTTAWDFLGQPQDKTLTYLLETSASTWSQTGPGQKAQGLWELAEHAEATWRASQRNLIHARSDLGLLAPYRNDQSLQLRGNHKIRGTLDLGSPSSTLDIPLSLEGDYHLVHADQHAYALGKSDIGPAAHRDETANLTLYPHLERSGSDQTFTLPLRYGYRRLTYTEKTLPLEGLVTHSLSSGIAIRLQERDLIDFLFEGIGITWSHTSLGVATNQQGNNKAEQTLSRTLASQRSPLLRTHERIDLRALNMERLLIQEDDLIFSASIFLGGSWLWSHQTEQDLALLAMGASLGVMGDHFSWTYGSSRRGTSTPDGQRFATVTRNEMTLEAYGDETDRKGFGLTLHGAHALWEHEEEENPVHTFALRSSWWFSPVNPIRAGFYHLATHDHQSAQGSAWDPWRSETSWGHELGIFVSLSAAE